MYLINASSNSLRRDEKVVYKCILHHIFGHNLKILRSPKTIFAQKSIIHRDFSIHLTISQKNLEASTQQDRKSYQLLTEWALGSEVGIFKYFFSNLSKPTSNPVLTRCNFACLAWLPKDKLLFQNSYFSSFLQTEIERPAIEKKSSNILLHFSWVETVGIWVRHKWGVQHSK